MPFTGKQFGLNAESHRQNISAEEEQENGKGTSLVSALILENTFTSILDMAGVLLPFLKWVIGSTAFKGPRILNFLVRSPWNTIEIIDKIKQPILFLSGLQDEMVPPVHMRMLYEKASFINSRTLFVDFPDGMHMDTWLSGAERYWRSIQLFLMRYLPQVEEQKGSSIGDSVNEDIHEKL